MRVAVVKVIAATGRQNIALYASWKCVVSWTVFSKIVKVGCFRSFLRQNAKPVELVEQPNRDIDTYLGTCILHWYLQPQSAAGGIRKGWPRKRRG